MGLLNPALRGFYETSGIRNYVLYGGRASSKTYHTAAFCVFLARNFKVKFLCTRQFQNRVSDSVKTVIEQCIDVAGLSAEFNVTETSIEHKATGSLFIFLGIQRNIKEIKGIANVDILWIEEAEDLTEDQWRILEPTIRSEGSRIFIVFNPRFSSDFVFKRFVTRPPPKTLVRHINYDENPFLSQTMKDIIAAAKLEDEEEYNHIYLGQPQEDDDQVIIKRSWIMASINAHQKLGIHPSGARRIGFDVADSGADKCASVASYGFMAHLVDEWKGGEDELLKSAGRVHALARHLNASIDFDSIGIGAYAGAHFQALNKEFLVHIPYYKFNAGGAVLHPEKRIDPKDPRSPKNKDFYANIKAQAWWEVSKRFRNTFNAVTHGEKFADDEIIAIDPEVKHLDQLIDELSTPRKDFDNNGKSKVESKKDLDKREIASPNLADAFVMAFAPRSGGAMRISDGMLQRAMRRN